jgi:hypothetical protein
MRWLSGALGATLFDETAMVQIADVLADPTATELP